MSINEFYLFVLTCLFCVVVSNFVYLIFNNTFKNYKVRLENLEDFVECIKNIECDFEKIKETQYNREKYSTVVNELKKVSSKKSRRWWFF